MTDAELHKLYAAYQLLKSGRADDAREELEQLLVAAAAPQAAQPAPDLGATA